MRIRERSPTARPAHRTAHRLRVPRTRSARRQETRAGSSRSRRNRPPRVAVLALAVLAAPIAERREQSQASGGVLRCAIAKPRRQRLYALVELRVVDEIKARQDQPLRDVAIG